MKFTKAVRWAEHSSAVALAMVITGCVSPHTTKPPAQGVDLRSFNTARIIVTDAVNSDYSRAGLPMFRGLLEARLELLGYRLVETNAQVVVAVKVRQFEPGSRAMRLLVGFGAGEAVLKYTATFLNESGKVLAELEGGKAYHGMELVDNASLKSNEAIRTDMLAYSVDQITEFIQSNGAKTPAATASKSQAARTGSVRPKVWSCARFSPDSGKLAAVGDGTAVFEFNIPEDRKGHEVELPSGSTGRRVLAVNYNPGGELLVLYSISNAVTVWNAQSRSVVTGHSLPATPAGGLLSRDGQRAVVYFTEKARRSSTTVELLSWGSHAGVTNLAPHDKGIRCLAFAADGTLLATMDGARVGRLWNTETGALLATVPAEKQDNLGLALDQDGDTLALAGPSTQILRLQGQQYGTAASVPSPAPKAGTTAQGAGVIVGTTLLGQPTWDPNWFKSVSTFGVCLTDKGERVAMLNHSPKIAGGFEVRLAEVESGRAVTTVALPDSFWPWGVGTGDRLASLNFLGDRTPGQPAFSPNGQFAAVPGSGVYLLDLRPADSGRAEDQWLASPPGAGWVKLQVLKPLPAEMESKQYKTVKLSFTDEVNSPYSKEGVPLFRGLLKGRLESMGYAIVETNAPMTIAISIIDFTPGDAATRRVFGFGPGAAVLRYNARFQDESGKLLGQLRGGKDFRGAETTDNQAYRTPESIRIALLSYATTQIAEFIQSSGANNQTAQNR